MRADAPGGARRRRRLGRGLLPLLGGNGSVSSPAGQRVASAASSREPPPTTSATDRRPARATAPILASSRVRYARKHHGALVGPSGGDRCGDRRTRACGCVGPPSRAPPGASGCRASGAGCGPQLRKARREARPPLLESNLRPSRVRALAGIRSAGRTLSGPWRRCRGRDVSRLEDALSDWRRLAPSAIWECDFPRSCALRRQTSEAPRAQRLQPGARRPPCLAAALPADRARASDRRLAPDAVCPRSPALLSERGAAKAMGSATTISSRTCVSQLAGRSPAGREVVDLRSSLSLSASACSRPCGAGRPGLAMRTLMPRRRPSLGSSLTRIRDISTSSTRPGWERTYLCVASLLRGHTGSCGHRRLQLALRPAAR